MSNAASIRETINCSLYVVDKSSYRTLSITDMRHSAWVVSHVLDGCVETGDQDEQWVAKTGNVMIHPPHLPFFEYAKCSGTHQWMLLDVALTTKIELFRLYPVPPVVPLICPSYYADTFDALLRTYNAVAAPFREIQALALATQLLIHILESWHASGNIARPASLMTRQDRFAQVIRRMEDSITQKITREELAALAHLHPSYFDRLFRQTYGISPMHMLRNMRMRRVQTLLESTDDTLDVIAKACGLGDASYVSRVFTQQFEQTPGQYRKSVKNTKEGYIPPL